MIRRLGDYELLEEVARGGMGIVYRARQVSLNRIVAVKVMRDSALAGVEEVKRFRVEAAAAARLKHPHIVAIHEIGEHEGQHYFAMDLVEGTDLARHTRSGPMPAMEAARIAATIAEAVQHAHEKGVLHRDLKPSNVLLDGQGQPFVTDFGLARSLDADSSLTVTGQVLGTPGYMPPEQAMGRGTVGPAADIYSLGAVLYHLLTGRAPFVGGTPAETMRHVVEQEPVSPQLLNPEVPRDLVSVCLKCLNKRPEDRYSSASDLAADLHRFLRGEPTVARPAGQTERLWRWCQRKPALAVAISLVALVGLTGMMGISWQWQRARAEAERARLNAYVADMNLAHQAYLDGNLGRATELLRRHRKSPDRGWEWRYLSRTCRSDERRTIGTFSDTISGVEFTSDGTTLATATFDGVVDFWNPSTWQPTGRLIAGERIRSMAFSPDSRLMAIGTLDHQISIWDWRRNERHGSFPCEQWSHGGALAFHPAGKLLAVAGRKGEIEIRSIPGLAISAHLTGHTSGSRSLAFSHDGRYLASGGDEEKLRVWDVASGQLLKTFPKPHAYAVTSVEFSPDGRHLVSSGWDNDVKLWDVETGQPIATFRGHAAVVYRARFSPDGLHLATASLDQTIRIWNLPSQRLVARLQGHEDEVTALTYSRDGQFLISGAKDRAVKIWDAAATGSENDRVAIGAGVIGGDVAGDGSMVAVQNVRRVDVWDTRSRNMIATFPHDPREPMVFAGNAGVMACGAADGHVRIFGADRADDMNVTGSHQNVGWTPQLAALALSADGRLLISVDVAGRAGTTDLTTGASDKRWQMATGQCVLAFSATAELAARAGVDGTVQIWRVKDGTRLAEFSAHRGTIGSICFSPNGQQIASGGWDGLTKLWDVPSSRLLATFRGFRSGVFRVAFSPDGSRLGTGTAAIKLWDLQTHQEVLTLREQSGKALFGFSPDGGTIISGSADGIRYWRAPSLDLFDSEDGL